MKSLNCIWYGMCTILKLYIERNCALNLSSIFHLFTSKLSLNPFNYTISMGSSDFCVCLVSLLLFSQQICQMKCVILTSKLVQMAKHQKKGLFIRQLTTQHFLVAYTKMCCLTTQLLWYSFHPTTHAHKQRRLQSIVCEWRVGLDG